MKTRKFLIASVFMFAMVSAAGCSANPKDLINKLFKKEDKELFTVYWKNYDGSILEIDEVEKDAIPSFDKTENPKKPMDDQYVYTFKGWDKVVAPITENTDFIAIYDQTPREYIVTWLNYDNSLLATTNVKYGDTPSYPGSTPVRQGDIYSDFEFTGWDRSLAPVTGNTSYKATYKETTYEVVNLFYSFDLDNLKHDVVNNNPTCVRSGSDVSLQNPTCKGYDFTGWYQDREHTKPIESSLSNLSGDLTLFGTFEVHHYSVSYDLNGGEMQDGLTNPIDITCEDEVVLNNPSKVGYDFTGWKDTKGTTVTKLEDVCENLSLKANYEAKTFHITLRYAEQNDRVIDVKYNESVTLPELKKDGYEFLGWYFEKEPDKKFELTIYTLLEDVSLIQKWSDAIEYTIEYQLNGGENPEDAPTKYSYEYVPALPTPIKEGYDFTGWYYNNNKITSLAGMFKNLVLEARWAPRQVNLTFDYDGGSLERNVSFFDGENKVKEVNVSPDCGVKFELLEDKSNAQFNGWVNKEDASSREGFLNDRQIKKNLALTAVWANLDANTIGAKIGSEEAFEVNGRNYQMFQYTPLVSQKVKFFSAGEIDLKAELIRKYDNATLFAADDNSATDLNFSFEFDLVANVSYLLKVSSNSDDGGVSTVVTTSASESMIPSGSIFGELYQVTSSQQKFDEVFHSVGTPVKKDMEFAGWYDENDNLYEDNATVLKKENLVLKAKWVEAQ